MGKPSKYDYSVRFSDSQEIQQGRERLLKALSAIESSLESAQGLEEHCKDLENLGLLYFKDTIQAEIQQYKSRIRGHKRAVVRLLEVSQGSLNLVRPKSIAI